MEKTSSLPDDFRNRLKIIEESTPTRVRLPEIKKIEEALFNLERTNNQDSIRLLNALNRAAGEIVKLRNTEQEGNEEIAKSFATQVSELNGAFTDVVMALTELPALIPQTDVKGIEERLERLTDTLQNKDTSPKIVNPEPKVNIDLKELKKELKAVEKAIRDKEVPKFPDIPQPEPVDLSGAEKLLRELKKSIEQVRDKPVPIPPTPHTYAVDEYNSIVTNGLPMDLQVDDTGTHTYLGNATPGTATSEAKWRIKRVTNATGVITHADGSSLFNKTWTARAGYTY